MTDQIVVNPGSDLVFSAVLTDELGPIDITGATLTTFELPSALLPQLTLTVTNALVGAFTATITWSNGFPREVVMPVRIRLVQDGLSTVWPPIKIKVPK